MRRKSERGIAMRFDNSSLFVNTGRKPLSTMQKRKRNTRNKIFLALFLSIVVILCVFVGLIVHVWINYDADEQGASEAQTAQVRQDKPEEDAEKKAEQKAQRDAEAKRKAEEKKKAEEEKAANAALKYDTFGAANDCTKAVDKAFSSLDGTYAYEISVMGSGYQYICNTAQIKNSTALSAFLIEYICAKIYTGEFDYDTNVSGYSGNSLIDSLIRDGSIDSANLLISHFTPAKLNAYMEAQGYTSTHFGAQLADGSGESFTTASDVTALIQKMYDKSKIFPYSDLYKRMRQSRVNTRIRAALPYETAVANISSAAPGECFDAGIVFSPAGNYIFVALASGYSDDGTRANTAIADGARAVFDNLNAQ